MSSNTERLGEIINVFGSYGFGEFYHRSFKKQSVEDSAINLRKAFEELGPSFIKIGQTLSTRNDLLSEPYIKELQKLQNSSPSFSFAEADQLFTEEIGQSLKETFYNVQEEPLATGSIAQVHYAELRDGSPIIVKIQRPHIQGKLIRDINLFIRVINMVPSVFTDIIVDPIEILEDLREQSLIELNFFNEAQATLRFVQNHKDRTLIKAPHPHLKYVTEKVLVQDYISGYDLTQVDKVEEQGYDLTDIAEKLVMSYLYQVFEDGYYHADPHPGNFIINDNKIYFIDFGIMGEIRPIHRQFLVNLLQALVMHDIDSLTRLILVICKAHGEVDEVSFYREVSQLYNRYLTSGFWSMDLSVMFQDFMRVALKHGLTFPHELVLLAKTVIVVQGVTQSLDPDMDFMQLFATFVTTSNSFNISDFLSRDRLIRQASRTINAGINLPTKLDRLLDNINNERLSVNLDFKYSDKRIREINQMLNRLVIAILLASIIISSGLIASSDNNVRFSNIGLFFFIGGVILALYLLFSFIRSRRK